MDDLLAFPGQRRLPVPHLGADEVIAALKASGGSMAGAAKMLNVARQSLYNRVLAEPALREARDEVREVHLDIAETGLVEAVKRSEPWAIQFFLKTQGRSRGYVERGGAVPLDASAPAKPRRTPEQVTAGLRALSKDELMQLELLVSKLENAADVASREAQFDADDDTAF